LGGKIRITTHSVWADWETIREVYDGEGNRIEPLEVEKDNSRKVTCWYCQGKGWLSNPFSEAGRIKAKSCHRCNGTGSVVLNRRSFRVSATFDAESVFLIKRFERKGNFIEVTEISPRPKKR
jgi:RecJ-like exonuclease